MESSLLISPLLAVFFPLIHYPIHPLEFPESSHMEISATNFGDAGERTLSLDIVGQCSPTEQHHQPQHTNVVRFMPQDLLREMKAIRPQQQDTFDTEYKTHGV